MPIIPSQAKAQNRFLRNEKYLVDTIFERIDTWLAGNFDIIGTPLPHTLSDWRPREKHGIIFMFLGKL